MVGKLVTCPYNRAHQIRPERIHYHLVKCAKQHPEADLVICPYNATHHVQPADEHVHLLKCPDRRIVEIQKYRFNDPLPGEHGDLSNPRVYGSAFIPVQVEEAPQQAGPPLPVSRRGNVSVGSLDETSASSVGAGYLKRSSRQEERAGPPPQPSGRHQSLRDLVITRQALRRVRSPDPSMIEEESGDKRAPEQEDGEEDVATSGGSLASQYYSVSSASTGVRPMRQYQPLRKPKLETLAARPTPATSGYYVAEGRVRAQQN